MPWVETIEEAATSKLKAELERRERLFAEGKCWYCGQKLRLHRCRLHEMIDREDADRKPPVLAD